MKKSKHTLNITTFSRRLRIFSVSLLSTLSLFALAETPDQTAFLEAQSLFSKGLYLRCIQKISELEKNYPDSLQKERAYNLKGLSYLMNRDAKQAEKEFIRALAAEKNSSFKSYISFNLATAQFELKRYPEAKGTLLNISPDGFDKANRFKYHFLMGKIEFRVGNPYEASRQFLTAARFGDENQSMQNQTIRSELDPALEKVNPDTELEPLYKEFENSPYADSILYRWALKKPEIAGVLRNKFPTSSYTSLIKTEPEPSTSQITVTQATNTSNPVHLENIEPADPNTVGVLLPLSGKFSDFGYRALHSIEYALGIFEQENHDGSASKITLAIEDSGDDSKTALEALDRLVRVHRSIAIIGPLLSKGVDLIAERAEQYQVPMITLSQQSPSLLNYVMSAGLTPQIQTHALVQFAVEKLGLKKFAIYHPRDKFGEQYAKSFWDAVEKSGAEVVGIENYSPGETDFRQGVDKLAGLYYTDARQKELLELEKQREELKIKKRTRKTEQYFSLKPIVDFDAVFVPDEARIVGQILPTFAYRDVDHVQFLGISSWNSKDLITRSEGHAEGAVFTSAFSPQSNSAIARNFATRYSKIFDATPTETEALAYDAAKTLERAMGTGASNRRDLREQLKKIQDFQGVTGRISVREGHFDRTLNLLRVKNSTIEEYSEIGKNKKSSP